jgi:hypothetical protein
VAKCEKKVAKKLSEKRQKLQGKVSIAPDKSHEI